jgi:8-oxo-dGTP pyrophosphatase MutT (NUDIX family)
VARLGEFYRDPQAPTVQALLPVAYAVVRDQSGRVLLVRRADDGNWELPGGRVETGETAGGAAIREIREEAGITVELTGIAGIYSDPSHIVVYPDGAQQQIAVVFHAHSEITPGSSLKPDCAETVDAEWFTPAATRQLTMHDAVRTRLTNAIARPETPHFE